MLHTSLISFLVLFLFLYLETAAASVAPSTEAGLLHGNDSSTTHSEKFEVVSTESSSNDAVEGLYLQSNSDMDDTFNGENSDIIIPHPKKYHSKYSDHVPAKKYKIKPKMEDVVNEKNLNVAEHVHDASISHAITSTATPAFISTSDQNTTAATNVTEAALSDYPLDVESVNETADTSLNGTENFAEDIETTSIEPFSFDSNMAVAAATSVDHELESSTVLDAGSITGITLGIVVISGLFGAISFVLYRRRYLNKPQALTDKSSTLDSSGYIDDTSLRENSEEMYSLDNDSFLNSLEAMTIQNYWTESVKHTKL